MNAKLQPIITHLKEAHRLLDQLTPEELGDKDGELGYEDFMNDADERIVDANDLLDEIV